MGSMAVPASESVTVAVQEICVLAATWDATHETEAFVDLVTAESAPVTEELLARWSRFPP